EVDRVHDAYGGAGDLAGALGMANEAVAAGRRRKTAIFEIIALLACARALLATEPMAAAVERDLDDATALVEAPARRGFPPFTHVERTQLAGLRSGSAARTHHVREAHRLFTAMEASARTAGLGWNRGPETYP